MAEELFYLGSDRALYGKIGEIIDTEDGKLWLEFDDGQILLAYSKNLSRPLPGKFHMAEEV